MYRRCKQALQNQSGVAMIAVLCMGMLLIALSAAMMYGASLLTASANKLLPEEDAYQLALSFSRRLETEITTADAAGDTTGIQAFLNDFLTPVENGGLYAEDTAYHFVTGNPADADEYGKISLDITKQDAEKKEEDDEEHKDQSDSKEEYIYTVPTYQGDTTDDTTWNNFVEGALKPNSENRWWDYELKVTVTATVGTTSYSITQTYERSAQYEITYLCSGDGKIYYLEKLQKPYTLKEQGNGAPFVFAEHSGQTLTRQFGDVVEGSET